MSKHHSKKYAEWNNQQNYLEWLSEHLKIDWKFEWHKPKNIEQNSLIEYCIFWRGRAHKHTFGLMRWLLQIDISNDLLQQIYFPAYFNHNDSRKSLFFTFLAYHQRFSFFCDSFGTHNLCCILHYLSLHDLKYIFHFRGKLKHLKI